MDKKKFDLTALGEVLIDFTPHGKSEQGNDLLEVNPGGAPCNVLAMAAKLGAKTTFIGKAGDDTFGRELKKTLETVGIDVESMLLDASVFTTLAFVHLDLNGDRSFSFCRNPGADLMLRAEEVDAKRIQETKIFHFGTLSMTDEPARSATKHAVQLAKESGAVISFDPNFRPLLWKDIKKAKEAMDWGFSQCDVLKISDNELELATDVENVETAVDHLCGKFPNIRLVLATMGERGCYFRYGSDSGMCPAYPVNVIDTTGAGDTFMGCCLYTISQKGLLQLEHCELMHMVDFANAAASIVTTRKGAIRSMPEREEIKNLMKAK